MTVLTLKSGIVCLANMGFEALHGYFDKTYTAQKVWEINTRAIIGNTRGMIGSGKNATLLSKAGAFSSLTYQIL